LGIRHAIQIAEILIYTGIYMKHPSISLSVNSQFEVWWFG